MKATYKYSREDVDELSFDVDEIIHVVEYDDPEEQVRPIALVFSKLILNTVLVGGRLADGPKRK